MSDTIHFHPIYSGLHCGAKTGIYHTNEKDINCPFCLSNLEATKTMQIYEYMAHYRAFDAEFFPKSWLEDIERKCLEEMDELTEVIELEEPLEMRISEATDVMNMAIKLLTAYGVKDVLHAGYMKLQETGKKYMETRAW